MVDFLSRARMLSVRSGNSVAKIKLNRGRFEAMHSCHSRRGLGSPSQAVDPITT